MGLRSRILACAATRARQTQTTTACPQHSSGLYRSHAGVVGDPEVMRRNLSLRIISAEVLIEAGRLKTSSSGRVTGHPEITRKWSSVRIGDIPEPSGASPRSLQMGSIAAESTEVGLFGCAV